MAAVTRDETPEQAATPYQGLRVVELSEDVAGEGLGKLLSTMGANVVKVEPPEGAASRRIGPWATGSAPDDVDASLTYWYYNVNKRSVLIDYRTPEGGDSLRQVLRGADVVITGWRPVDWQSLGLTPEGLRHGEPQLIVVNLSPFGLDGPWANMVTSDLVGLALGSPLNSCGYDDHSIPPIRPGGDQGYQSTASFGHLGLLLALLERDRTGVGQVVDVAMHDCLSVSAELANPYWFYPRVTVKRQTFRHAQPTPTQPAHFATRDGGYVYFALITAEEKPWRSLLEWMDEHGLAADLVEEPYQDPAYRLANFSHIQGMVEAFFLLQDAADAYHEGQARGLPIAVLNAPEDLLDDTHLRERGFFVPVDDDAPGGPHLYPAPGLRFSALASPPMRRAPRLGEHSAEVLGARDDGLDASVRG